MRTLSTICVMLAALAVRTSADREPFTVVVLPDTQVYASAHPKHFIAQTRWIRENREKRNIVFVAHVGDITNNATDREWKVADEAFKLLDDVVPVGLSVGNHDFDKLSVRKRNTAGFNHYFGIKRYEKHAWYAGHMGNDNDNSFQRFEAGGMKFLVIDLEFGPPDDVIAWANEVAAKYPNHRVILNTHCYMYSDDTRVGPGDKYNPHRYDAKANDGEELWRKLVSKHPNFHFVLSGHILGDGLGRLTSEGQKGNKVHQVLVNYQMRRQGGQGYLRLMRFVPRENKVYCKSYSPVLDRYKEDPENQFALQYDMRLPTDAGAAVGTSTKEPKPKEMLVDVRKIWDKAPHNAFTDLVRFKGKWFCVFREGEGHVSLDGKIRVITSTDGTDWTSAALIASSDPKLPDMRDAKLSVTPDGRLMLVTAASTRWYVGKERQHHYRTYATFSDDGSTWEKLVQIGDENFWLWRVTWHKGTAFTNGYTVTGPRFLRLYTSADGRDFKPLVAKHTVRGYIGEDTILFTEDGTAYCLLRSAEPGWLGRAKSPYTEWTWKQLNVQIGGPHMVQLPDGRFLAAGRKYHKTKPVRYTTVLWWVDVDKGRLTEFLELPSGGDTSYPGLVPHDGLLWVSYYSSHERNKACIYLAKVKLPPKT